MLGFNRQNKSINTTGGASMNKSIQHFIEFGTEKLEKKMVEFASEPTKIAEMVYACGHGRILNWKTTIGCFM